MFFVFFLKTRRPFIYLFFWLCPAACDILVPRPGIKPGPLAVRAPSPNHWPAREVPERPLFKYNPSTSSVGLTLQAAVHLPCSHRVRVHTARGPPTPEPMKLLSPAGPQPAHPACRSLRRDARKAPVCGRHAVLAGGNSWWRQYVSRKKQSHSRALPP